MRVLLTGAAGYAGRGIAQMLRAQYQVRGLDIAPCGDDVEEAIQGDLADLDVCRQAMAGMEAMVLCHMARNPDGYEAPPPAFDINVKGTANLFHAAVECGVTRCVLISTTDVIDREKSLDPRPGDGPYAFNHGLYGLTKVLQECIARHYHDKHGVSTVILRPGWIVYDGNFITKYGFAMDHYDNGLIDPRDIGVAVASALALPDAGLEAYQLGQDDSGQELAPVRQRLGWAPKYLFTGLPRK